MSAIAAYSGGAGGRRKSTGQSFEQALRPQQHRHPPGREAHSSRSVLALMAILTRPEIAIFENFHVVGSPSAHRA
jgi:hypothetical protein